MWHVIDISYFMLFPSYYYKPLYSCERLLIYLLGYEPTKHPLLEENKYARLKNILNSQLKGCFNIAIYF